MVKEELAPQAAGRTGRRYPAAHGLRAVFSFWGSLSERRGVGYTIATIEIEIGPEGYRCKTGGCAG